MDRTDREVARDRANNKRLVDPPPHPFIPSTYNDQRCAACGWVRNVMGGQTHPDILPDGERITPKTLADMVFPNMQDEAREVFVPRDDLDPDPGLSAAVNERFDVDMAEAIAGVERDHELLHSAGPSPLPDGIVECRFNDGSLRVPAAIYPAVTQLMLDEEMPWTVYSFARAMVDMHMAYSGQIQTEAARMEELLVELQGRIGDSTLLSEFRQRVADTSMDYALRYDWCDQVLECLAELGIKLAPPVMHLKVLVAYEFDMPVPFEDLHHIQQSTQRYVWDHITTGPLTVRPENQNAGHIGSAGIRVEESELRPMVLLESVSHYEAGTDGKA